jgi:PAS domain S-box-containing protein
MGIITFKMSFRFVLTIQVIIMALIVGTIIYLFSLSESIGLKHTPQIDASCKIWHEATIAHLWFEEILAGDRSETLENVLKHIDKAQWYARALLEGGEKQGTMYYPLEDSVAREKIKKVSKKIAEFKKITEKRWETIEVAGTGTEISQQYNAVFKDFIQLTTEVGVGIRRALKAELIILERLHKIVVLSAVIMAAIAFVTFFSYDIEQRKSQRSLRRLNEELRTEAEKFEAANKKLQQEIEVRKKAEEEIERIFNMTNYMVCVADLSGSFIRVNSSFSQILGYSKEELLAKPYLEIIHPDDVAKTKAVIEEELKRGTQVIDFENRYLCKDGTYKWLSWSSRPVVKEGIMYAIAYDITERIEAEEEVLSLSKFPAENPNPVMRVEKEGHLLFANHASDDLLELWNCREGEKLPENIREKVSVAYDSNSSVEIEVECKGRIISLIIAPVAEMNYLNFYGRDITERKQAAEALLYLNRLLDDKNKELESIVYVASHDLRSPLVNIQGFSRELENVVGLLREAIDKGEFDPKTRVNLDNYLEKDIPETLRFISAGTIKIDGLLSGLLKLSRMGRMSVKIEEVDMNDLMGRVLASNGHQLKEADAELKIDDLPNCRADASQLNQTFTNLLDNAIKYRDPSRKCLIHISGWKEDKNAVYCIEDNGIGIDLAYQAKVFEIFHRLDTSIGAGEGLGLTIVRRILDRLGGTVRLESETGKGSRFYVSLPFE